MSENRGRKRVRPVSRETGHGRIRSLKCFDEVYTRIVDGWSPNEIATFIQEVRNEAGDISHVSLVTMLHQFKSSLPPGEVVSRKNLPPAVQKKISALDEGLDELKEFEKLYRLQMDRINIGYGMESKIGALIPTMGAEVRIAKEILTAVADLKMDLGIAKRHIGAVEVNAQLLADVAVRYQKPEVQKVMADPQSRKRILGLAERLLSRSSVGILPELPDREVIDVEMEPSIEDQSKDDAVGTEPDSSEPLPT